MESFVDNMNLVLGIISGLLWHPYVLYFILLVGILFTLWSGFCQYRALTHGVAVVRGKYDDPNDPGAINHFQALTAALSATVGIGNIGGVAGAIALGGPGAVFWMWIVGIIGMALKVVEVSLAMIYRNVDDPDNPHGGAMWVADRGLPKLNPNLGTLGKVIGAIFCVTLLISTVTGGNMAQSWNVAEVTHGSFEIPRYISGIVLAILCGLVIIGGIKVIGRVTGFLVPFMCIIYLTAGIYVLTLNAVKLPEMFTLIFQSAFGSATAKGAFVGGTVGYAFSWGMKRAFFSNEAGQGSAPIAHSAAKTDEPIREGLVAGIGPFIDTIMVCTITAMIILSSGAWNRDHETHFSEIAEAEHANVNPLEQPSLIPVVLHESEQPGEWITSQTDTEASKWKLQLKKTLAPKRYETNWNPGEWKHNQQVFVMVEANKQSDTNHNIHRMLGKLVEEKVDEVGEGENTKTKFFIEWEEAGPFTERPKLVVADKTHPVYVDYVAAQLTSHAFDRVSPGLGYWMIPIGVWLFALSTAISWSYYGEQGIIYLFGDWLVMPYRVAYCLIIFGIAWAAHMGYVTTEKEIAGFTDLGTGVMLLANLPICLIFAHVTMKAYYNYIRRLKAGEFTQPGRKSETST
ncbi:MAG: alanine/glycine:cation symporter family protein [Gemmataceae bacterium]